jgi:hypothetical protein
MNDKRRKDEEDLKTHRICAAYHSISRAVEQLDLAGQGHADDCACALHRAHRKACTVACDLHALIQARQSYAVREV